MNTDTSSEWSGNEDRGEVDERVPFDTGIPEDLPHNPEKEIEEPLQGELLEVIGKRLGEETVLAPAIHTDIVVRWEEILKRGLPKEEREILIKKYPPPENARGIAAPKLNPEIKVCIQETILKRDERIVAKQGKIAACLAAVGKALSRTIKEDFEGKISLFEQLSDISRLLVDLQYDESSVRRNLIQPNINAAVRDTLKATISDEMLFGKSLGEKIKATKEILQSSKDFKVPSKTPQAKNSKNFKGPSRRFSTPQISQHPSSSGQRKHSIPTNNNRFKKSSFQPKDHETSTRRRH